MISVREGAREIRFAGPLCALRASLSSCLALLTIAFCPVTALAAEPLYTNNPRFRIPFQFDREEMTRIGAVEVQLHVSTDQGGRWSLVESVAPSAQSFTFETPRDGHYWFAVRTIDLRGRPHPEGPLQPGLTVAIDQTDPSLVLAAADLGGGEFEARWQATDEHLDLSSLRIEVLDESIGAWQPLPIAATPSGSVSFRSTSSTVQIRGSVSDRAGNSATADASAAGAAPASRSRAPEAHDFREPIAGRSHSPGSSRSTLRETSISGPTPVILPNMPHAPVPAAPSAGSSWPVREVPTQSTDATPVFPGTTAPPAWSIVGSATATTARRMNTRHFRVGYEVQNVGPSGVGSVELYITEDGGRKWFHYGSDPDRQSPFEAVVPRDGTYGFAIRVRNGQGVVADPPQPGEPPEVVVIVDQTAPTARLMPLQQAAQNGHYQVRISWFAQDDCLAERPVALFESSQPEGPWEPISGWIENQGRFDWAVSSFAPRKVYIRLEVRDAAGNVATAVTDQPLLIDTTPPTARILHVETSAGAASTE